MQLLLNLNNFEALYGLLFLCLKGGIFVTKEQFEREKNYRISIAIAKSMLSKNIIDEDDFEKIKKMFIDKYRPAIETLTFN